MLRRAQGRCEVVDKVVDSVPGVRLTPGEVSADRLQATHR